MSPEDPDTAGGAKRPRRRRLLWLIDSLNMGGAESLVLPFVRSYDRDEFELHVCCLAAINGNPMEAEVRAEGVPFTNLEARSLRDVRAFRRLIELTRGSKIDLIHAHLTYASIWSAAASRITGVPAIASLHVAPPESGAAALRDWLMRRMLQRWGRMTLAVSEDLRAMYVKRGGLDADRIAVVHNGIETERFRSDHSESRRLIAELFGIPLESRVIVTVSVLRPGKGIEILLDAAGRVLASAPDAWLLVLGDGPMAGEWQARGAAVPGGERIRWGGFRRDVHRILPGCDLLVHPTLADAFPTVLLEAMAAGLPVVASRIGGVPEIVVEGTTGRLVPPGDANALAEAIGSMLENDGERAAMGRAASSVAEHQFSTRAWMGRLSSVYAVAAEIDKEEKS